VSRITGGGVSRARSVMAERIKESKNLAARVSAVEERLQAVKS
jgi:hypothetical protein